jgi:membrane protease YdiL (CAAX protease family)
MSTLAVMDPKLIEAIVLSAMTAAGILVVVFTRSYRAASVVGPARVPRDEFPAPLIAATMIAFVCWFGAQVAYVSLSPHLTAKPQAATAPSTQAAAQPTTTQLSTDLFTPRDLAFLTSVPALLACGVFLIFLATDRTPWMRMIGLGRHHLALAPLLAILTLLVAFPLVTWAFAAVGKFYEAIDYSHPTEHEMLRSLSQQPSTFIKVIIALAATVIAPLHEELLFRGGMQTLLRRVFGDSPARVWVAIVVTSLAFALIHSIWMAPAIFILSLCIGYLYERTGNLWAAILMHAGFNAVNTALFALTR